MGGIAALKNIGRAVRRTFPAIALVALLAGSLAVPDAFARTRRSREAEAAALVERAQRQLARGGVEQRRLAVQALERATTLVPGNAEYQLLLARAYYRSGWLRAAMKRFERVASLQPDDASARLGLAQVWRRDWLKYLETSSLDHSIREAKAAVGADTALTEAWVMLASLLTARGDSLGALGAAERAVAVAPGEAEAQLALAAGLWRTGRAEESAAAFAQALPLLDRRARERWEDFAPLASERDTAIYNHLPPAEKREFERRFWAEHDPDLSTALNEARLEYWTRCTQAYFLWYDRKHREWDERGEVYVRFGPPEKVAYNPLGAYLYSRGPGMQAQFPMNVLVWSYPSLGMTVTMQDRVLSEYYLLPMSSSRDMDPRPEPDSVARGDRMGTRQQRGVFPVLPPGVKPVPLRAQVARFEGANGPQLFAAVEAPARPGDGLVAECVVLDSLHREVARVSGALAPSGCRADSLRVASFSLPLPPGDYLLGLSVRGDGRRGTLRERIRLVSAVEGLLLSDLLVTCGAPGAQGAVVRLDANPSLEVPAGEPLTAYFEAYGLTADSAGVSRFEYSYQVRSASRGRRTWLARFFTPGAAAPELDGLWTGETAGPLRRQFVRVPLDELPAGTWRLEVRARDLVTGDVAVREAQFVRLPPPAARGK